MPMSQFIFPNLHALQKINLAIVFLHQIKLVNLLTSLIWFFKFLFSIFHQAYA